MLIVKNKINININDNNNDKLKISQNLKSSGILTFNF